MIGLLKRRLAVAGKPPWFSLAGLGVIAFLVVYPMVREGTTLACGPLAVHFVEGDTRDWSASLRYEARQAALTDGVAQLRREADEKNGMPVFVTCTTYYWLAILEHR